MRRSSLLDEIFEEIGISDVGYDVCLDDDRHQCPCSGAYADRFWQDTVNVNGRVNK